MRVRIILVIMCLVGFSLSGMAQKEVRSYIRKGNKLYKSENYKEAELEYRKALEINQKDREANYNLANTLYRTDRGEEAGKLYMELAKEAKLLPKERAADLTHNAGNLAMGKKDYASAIEMYKESLRNRPTDEETRYNLALAQKLLEKEQQEGGGNDNKENRDENEQQQDSSQDKQQQDNNQQQQNQQNKPQEQPQQGETMSRDNAEKILQAYLQDEKETQKKVEQMKQQQQKGKRSRPKNW